MLKSIGISIVFVAIAFANVSATTIPLALDQAIEIALQQNKDVQIARIAVSKADAQANEAVGNALPTLSLFGNYNYNTQIPAFFFPVGPDGEFQIVRAGLSNAYQVGAQFNQVLFNSAVFTGIGAAKIYREVARKQYRSVVATVITETKKRYYGALASNQLLGITQATLENAQQNYETVDALFKEGLVAEFDQIRADVAVNNIRPEVTNSKALYSTAVSALMTYLAMDIGDTVILSTDGLGDPLPVPDEQAALEAALEANYDLLAIKQQLEVLDDLVDVEQSTYYPTLNLIGNIQNQGQSQETFGPYLNVTSSFVGLNLNFNLFQGGRTIARVQQAKADYMSAQQQYENLKNNVQLQVRSVINDLSSAFERIQAQQSTVDQAQRGFDISRIRYTEGTGSLLEINDAEVSLSRAQVNRLQALFDYYTKRADYDRVIGNIPDQFLMYVED